MADYSVIGANSVFKGETQKKSVYCGNPAVFVKERNIDVVRMSNKYFFR